MDINTTCNVCRYLGDDDKSLTDAWFEHVKSYLLHYSSDEIDVVFQTSQSLNEELAEAVKSVLPLFSLTYIILLSFAVFASLMLDWVSYISTTLSGILRVIKYAC